MKLITHDYFDINIGVKFTVLCPVPLKKRQVSRAIQLQWLRMNSKAREKARQSRSLCIHLPVEAAELL